ncbi:unnamed protein product, partial [Mesorhabditis belari]|uniref:Uncharacterized protein n=1 Tax=Mesorhabditis belari TaxID=2138241 RepID=A0AAF3EDP0_9BILA
MPRHICIKSKDRLDGWNYNWIPIATDDSPYARMVKEIEEKEKFVQQYYLANQEQFADVRTLQGQMRMEDSTGVHGGSFVLHSNTHAREHIIRHLVRAFLVLARAINEGHFNVNTLLTVSLKVDSNWKVYCNRVKLDMSDSIYLVDVLKNIQRSFKRSHCMHYSLKFKSHVASYLSQLREFQKTKPFDSPLRTTTEQIDDVLRKLKPIFHHYSVKTTADFLKATSVDNLKAVDYITLTCNPKNQEPRYISCESKEPLGGWNNGWKPTTTKRKPSYAKLLKERSDQAKLVQDRYTEKKKQKRYTVEAMYEQDGQMRLEDSTGVRGGVFVFYSQRFQPGHLAQGFWVLAKALNSGRFNINETVTITLENCRSKGKRDERRLELRVDSPGSLSVVLKNVQRIFEQNNCKEYKLHFKTNVACYLCALPEFEKQYAKFDDPLQGNTEILDELIQDLQKAGC